MVPTTPPSLLDAKPVSLTSPAFWTCGDCGRTTASQWGAATNFRQFNTFVLCELCGRAAELTSTHEERCKLPIKRGLEFLVHEPDLQTLILEALGKALVAWAKAEKKADTFPSPAITSDPRAWHQIGESEPLEETG